MLWPSWRCSVLLPTLGLDGIVVRDLVNHPGKRDIYCLGTAFWLKLMGALLTLITLAIAVQFASNDATLNLYIFIIASGLIFQSFEVVDSYFQSKVLSKFVSIAKLVQLALSSLLKLYLVFIQADLFWFVLVSLIDQISLAFSLVFAYWRQKIGNFFGGFSVGTSKAMLRDSWPLLLSGIAIMLYMRIDQIMIKEMLGERGGGAVFRSGQTFRGMVFRPRDYHLVPLSCHCECKKDQPGALSRKATKTLHCDGLVGHCRRPAYDISGRFGG